MPDSWWSRCLTSLRAFVPNRWVMGGKHPGSEAVPHVESRGILWRIVFVLFAAVIVGQAWWPRPLTAQTPPRSAVNSPSESTHSDGANQRPFSSQGEGVNGTTRNSKRNVPPRVNQPSRRPVDYDRQDYEADVNQDEVQSVRPNRVARAAVEQEQPTTEMEVEEESSKPPFQMNSLLNADQLVSPQGLKSSLGMGLIVTVLSLAPAILMMSTCFVRFIVVLSLLRQALGTPNLPPNQVLMGLSLCLTFLVMAPVWNESYQEGIRPYAEATSSETRPSLPRVFDKTVAPIRRFMSHQIEKSNNADAVWMFVEYQRPAPGSYAAENWQEPETYDDVSLTVLLPAYVLSELKTAFLIGFQIYLPFLIIDLVVASVLMSMGLSLLSPTQVSLPFKLLLFVLIDGWTLTVGMLIESVRVAT